MCGQRTVKTKVHTEYKKVHKQRRERLASDNGCILRRNFACFIWYIILWLRNPVPNTEQHQQKGSQQQKTILWTLLRYHPTNTALFANVKTTGNAPTPLTKQSKLLQGSKTNRWAVMRNKHTKYCTATYDTWISRIFHELLGSSPCHSPSEFPITGACALMPYKYIITTHQTFSHRSWAYTGAEESGTNVKFCIRQFTVGQCFIVSPSTHATRDFRVARPWKHRSIWSGKQIYYISDCRPYERRVSPTLTASLFLRSSKSMAHVYCIYKLSTRIANITCVIGWLVGGLVH